MPELPWPLWTGVSRLSHRGSSPPGGPWQGGQGPESQQSLRARLQQQGRGRPGPTPHAQTKKHTFAFLSPLHARSLRKITVAPAVLLEEWVEILASNFSTMLCLFRGSVWGTTSHELCMSMVACPTEGKKTLRSVSKSWLDAKGSGPASAPSMRISGPHQGVPVPLPGDAPVGALGSCLPPAPLRLGDWAGG